MIDKYLNFNKKIYKIEFLLFVNFIIIEVRTLYYSFSV